MIRSALPPGPLNREDRVIVVPAEKLSESQRNFIRASVRYARDYLDSTLEATMKTWKIDPTARDYGDD